MEKQPQPLKPILNAFGLEYCLQGTFEDPAQLAQAKSNWLKIGHKTMIKNKNVLYVTRFKA